jgi:glycerol-3-phosphate O-acyltransferase
MTMFAPSRTKTNRRYERYRRRCRDTVARPAFSAVDTIRPTVLASKTLLEAIAKYTVQSRTATMSVCGTSNVAFVHTSFG